MPIRSAIKRTGIIFLLLALFTGRIFSQVSSEKPVRMMFYNVENFFDIFNDSLKDDDAFLPDGVMRWNQSRYNKKINSLYKTIVAAGEWNSPAVVAFCEIENRKVLEDLVYGTYLSKNDYGIIHEESPDPRGIDVCLIYRKELVKLLGYDYWIPSDIKRKDFTSRSVLYAKFLISNDTIHLIVNHWPSRRGGVLAGEDLRVKIALMVRAKADSIMHSGNNGTKIIIGGDFNCSPEDHVIKSLLIPSDSSFFLENLSEVLAMKGEGTYRYSGSWEMIDQVIVSNALLKCNHGLFTSANQLRIFKPDFLMQKDPKFPGGTPFSTYHGFKYQGGFSDHLPVLLDLDLK